MQLICFKDAVADIKLAARKALEEAIWMELNEGALSEANANRLLAELLYIGDEHQPYINDNNA